MLSFETRLDRALAGQPTVIEAATPKTEDEVDFKSTVCKELVFAWRDAGPEGKECLERVMMNIGLEVVGEVGETVPFDGTDHVTEDPLRPGDPAEVIEPGWALLLPQTTLMITRAVVVAAQQ